MNILFYNETFNRHVIKKNQSAIPRINEGVCIFDEEKVSQIKSITWYPDEEIHLKNKGIIDEVDVIIFVY